MPRYAIDHSPLLLEWQCSYIFVVFQVPHISLPVEEKTTRKQQTCSRCKKIKYPEPNNKAANHAKYNCSDGVAIKLKDVAPFPMPPGVISGQILNVINLKTAMESVTAKTTAEGELTEEDECVRKLWAYGYQEGGSGEGETLLWKLGAHFSREVVNGGPIEERDGALYLVFETS